MATLLDAQVIAQALTRLPEWSGGPAGLIRTSRLTEDQHVEVQRDVMERADAMNHHPNIERSGDQTRFTLSTHSAGGVTALDLALAPEIDSVLRAVTGSG